MECRGEGDEGENEAQLGEEIASGAVDGLSFPHDTCSIFVVRVNGFVASSTLPVGVTTALIPEFPIRTNGTPFSTARNVIIASSW